MIVYTFTYYYCEKTIYAIALNDLLVSVLVQPKEVKLERLKEFMREHLKNRDYDPDRFAEVVYGIMFATKHD